MAPQGTVTPRKAQQAHVKVGSRRRAQAHVQLYSPAAAYLPRQNDDTAQHDADPPAKQPHKHGAQQRRYCWWKDIDDTFVPAGTTPTSTRHSTTQHVSNKTCHLMCSLRNCCALMYSSMFWCSTKFYRVCMLGWHTGAGLLPAHQLSPGKPSTPVCDSSSAPQTATCK